MDPKFKMNPKFKTSPTAAVSKAEDDWETIPQKKDKKKKKKQRPVPLQEFFSSENCSHEDHVEYRAHQYREKETELTHDEEVMSASLHSYFGDLLKQTGPVRVDDAKFAESMASLDPECRKLVARFPSASAFLALSDELAVVDKFVCTKGDVTRALGMAVETVLNNASTNPSPAQRLKGLYATTAAAAVAGSRSGASSPASRATPVSAAAAPPPPVSVWSSNSLPHAKTASESLFSSSGSPASLPIGRPPADITVPPPPLIPKSFVPVVGAAKAGFGTIGNVPQVQPGLPGCPPLPQDASQMQDAIENLNKKLMGLTKSNSDLLQQLGEREKQIQKLGSLLSQNNDLIRQNEKLKVELREAQRQLQKMKAAAEANSEGESGKGSPDPAEDGELSEGQLIMRLKNQLETERLSSWTLKQQLEIERGYSARLTDRQALSLSNSAPGAVGPGGVGGAGGGVGGVGGLGQIRANSGVDSLGLRSLLGNIAPSMPTSTYSPVISLAPGSASSTFSTSTFSSSGSGGHLGLGGLGSIGGGITAPPPGLGGPAPKLGLGQIMSELRISLPSVREEDLHQHLANLKKDHGQLSSIALPKIVKLVSEAVKKSSPSL